MLDVIERRARAALLPPPRLPLSDWIEAHVVLPPDVSALPGPVRLYSFQRGIADAMTDPAVERVTLVKSVRLGFTTLLSAALASFAANEPSPILALLPTESDARDYMVSDLEPIFDASPALAGLMSPDGDRNTLLSRRFPGGSLKLVAAKAPRNLRRHNVRVLLVDEADAMLPGSEGSPIALAEKRTLSFPNRKIIVGSTPTDHDTSNVLPLYERSDKRVFEVPCPCCGGLTEILWRHIEWPEGRPEDAAFRCPHCRELVPERFKAEMVAAGAWRATAPHVRGHAGFRLNALVSLLPNASWGKLAAEFLAAKDDADTLRVFVNTILAEGWRESADTVDESALAGRLEAFGLNAIPAEVLALTIGVDVQDDRLELSYVGWTRDDAALVLAHETIWGSSQDDTTWSELDERLRTAWSHPYGGRLKVDAAVVDSGDGGITDKVYAFCFPRLSRRIWAGKGVAGPRPAIIPSKAPVKGGRLFIIGVDGIKTTVFDRLKRGTLLRFGADLDEVYFSQLASERRVVRYVRGQPVRRFERVPGARAEALDCLVYAFAARRGVTITYDSREADLRTTAPVAPRQARVIPPSFPHRR